MHLGNARTALLAWLHSRASSGRHLLRFEDLDRGRVRDFAVDLTRRDLDWLGLDWDDEVRQSRAAGPVRLGPRAARTLPVLLHAPRDRRGRERSARRRTRVRGNVPGASARAGRTPALRWRVPDAEVCASDVRLGALCQHLPSEVGDVVLRRADGAYAYHLAVVVDDAAQGVTTVVRGEDLWPSTPRQVALQRALGLPTPEYLHVPLLLDFHGRTAGQARRGARRVGPARGGRPGGSGAGRSGAVAGLVGAGRGDGVRTAAAVAGVVAALSLARADPTERR
jgi:glutamyl-tRNA synthetase